jgi:TonB family protein
MPTPTPGKIPKDRMSIGSAEGPVQREFNPDKTTTGSERRPGAPGVTATPAPEAAGPDQSATQDRQGFRPARPEGRGDRPQVAEDRSLLGSARRQEQRLADLGAALGQGGVTRQMGPLQFDPQGADFTAWINHWRNELYRNWIAPEAAVLGYFNGCVAAFEYVVERDGSVSSLRLMNSTGSRAMDKAAENALRGARFLPLPQDYAPPRVKMGLAFLYCDPDAVDAVRRRNRQGS